LLQVPPALTKHNAAIFSTTQNGTVTGLQQHKCVTWWGPPPGPRAGEPAMGEERKSAGSERQRHRPARRACWLSRPLILGRCGRRACRLRRSLRRWSRRRRS
jgi:hypothetical protein